MNALMADCQANLKRCICIALVGIRPSDRILLKKYLHELLALKVDINWVLVSYPQVDLFLIGREFSDSIVVNKLLADQPDKPVLYVSQDEDEEGRLVDNKIFLPLPSLDDFNEWLLKSVAVLSEERDANVGENNESRTNINIIDEDKPLLAKQIQGRNTTLDSESSTNSDNVPSNFTAKLVTDSDESKQISGNGNIAASQIKELQPKNNQSTTTLVTTSKIDYKNTLPIGSSIKKIQGYEEVIAITAQIQQEVSGLYQMSMGSQIVSIIEPSRGKVWPAQFVDDALALGMGWQLQPYTAEPPSESADDLIQYLWQYSWIYADLLGLLVDDEMSYQLEWWIKPVITIFDNSNSNQVLTKKERQQLLATMNALELKPSNINQLSDVTGISVDDTKKIVASLLFSGSLKGIEKPISQYLSTPVIKSNVDNTGNAEQVTVESDSKDYNSQGTASIEQQILNDETADLLTNAKQAKRGFLSRLRSKLGL